MQHLTGAEIWSSQIVDFGCVNVKQLNFVVSGWKFTRFFSAQFGRGCIWYLLFQVLISRSTPAICVIKVKSCPKSHRLPHLQILMVQAPKNLYPNIYTCVAAHHLTSLVRTSLDKFGKVIPTGLKVIRHNTHNCSPIFEFLLSFKFYSVALN